MTADDLRYIDWMEHGLRVRQAVLPHAAGYIKAGMLSRPDVARIKRDVVLRQRVLAAIHRQQRIDPEGLSRLERIWRDWMLAHAGLQIARYAGVLTEAEHSAHCFEIRLLRDERAQAI